jgi:hypothetical protein
MKIKILNFESGEIKMKKFVCKSAGAVVMCILLGFVSNLLAADANQPKKTPKEAVKEKTTAIGTVSESKDKDGNVAQVMVKVSKNVVYQVVLNVKGRELGKTMSGKKVKVVGEVKVQGDIKWLTVDKFEEQPKVEPKPQPKPKPKPPVKQ